MNPRNRECLKLVQHNLKAKRTKLFLSLLASLFGAHPECVMSKELGPLLRARDFASMYSRADALSSQLYEDADTHFSVHQFAQLLKKYPWPTDLLDLKPRERAISTFLASEKRAGLVNRKFAFLRDHPGRDVFSKECSAARYHVRSIIGSFPNYRAVFSKADFGPGASVGVGGDATSFSAKITAETWTVTPGAIHHGYACIRSNYHMWELLLPKGKNGLVCYDEEAAFAAYLSKIEVIEHNKISFVPKTAKTDRTIAVEPLLNGLTQKGIDQVLRKKLLNAGINLEDQGKNQEFARLGSLDDSDDGFVTIDLKSASDSISTELVRYLLPYDWFNLLDRTRSKLYKLEDGFAPFKKFCSMGNGFCFPLETLIFLSACLSVGCGVPGVDFVVYGDDIVVRKKYATQLIQLLNHWGFKINSDKTFLEGPFRESCGKDWFGGKDVRPFTLDYELDSLSAYFKYLNLSRRNERTTKFFAPIRDNVVRHIPEQFRFYRPLEGESDTGIDSLGDEFLSASACTFHKGKWWWHELVSRSRVDYDTVILGERKRALMGECLRGAKSIGSGLYIGSPKVALRNRPQTKVVRKGYVSTSNWLPTT